MKLQDHNLADASEIATLCHYLREKLIHEYGAWHMLPSDEVGLLNRDSWHVSFANDGKAGYNPVISPYLYNIFYPDSDCDEVTLELSAFSRI